MGPVLLILALLALSTTSCGQAERSLDRHEEGDPHREVSCLGCHAGEQLREVPAAVPSSSCTAVGCHDDGGLREVTVRSVSFPHRDHETHEGFPMTCSACHGHAGAHTPLRVHIDACVLCHAPQIRAASVSADCSQCHPQPRHVRMSSQGEPIPHDRFPELGIGCDRCHYDVLEPAVHVDVDRCHACHDPRETQAGFEGDAGGSLHARHQGLACRRCHEPGQHRLGAMSTAVALDCAACHPVAHDEPVSIAASERLHPPCNECHGDIHRDQQAFFLGTVQVAGARSSTKFLAGLTCESCHAQRGALGDDEDRALARSADACVECHETDFALVLEWWETGLSARLARGRSELEAARVALRSASPAAEAGADARAEAEAGAEGDTDAGANAGDEDTVASRLREAGDLLTKVDQAGGVHNLELSHRLFENSRKSLLAAYEAAGVAAPALSSLGVRPHMGLCSYCHYDQDEPFDLQRMNDTFHGRNLATGTR